MDTLSANAARQRAFRQREREKQFKGSLYRTAAAMVRADAENIYPAEAARVLFGSEHGLEPVLKAASNPATLGDPNWAGPLGHNVVRSDLIQPLTALSAAAALMDAGVQVDLTGLASITIPGRLLDVNFAGTWVAEGVPISVRATQVAPGPTLTPKKIAVITVYTREQAESSAIEAFVKMAITEASALLLDAAMFSSNAATAAQPAGILAGATTVTPSADTATWAISKDIGALVEALALYGGGLEPILIAAPAQAASLRMWRQQDFYDIYASNALSAGTVVAVEKSSFVSVADPMPNFEVRTEATLQMQDAPTAGLLTSSPVKSLFTTDSIALKMILRANWGLRNPHHVAIMTGVSW